jgi:acyl-CoA synthetase (AMP-forming)/AMP-acid ligase II
MTMAEARGEHRPLEQQRNLIRRVNVGDMVTRSAARSPDDPAVVDGERRMSYGQLNGAVNRLANALAARGYRRGEALALVSGNSLEFLQTYYACAKLGVVCVPINLGWRPVEVTYVLEHSRARGVVVESQLAEWLTPSLARAARVQDVFVARGTSARDAPATWTPLDELVAHASSDEPACFVDDRDPLTYLYTSGTTAAPKGVIGSHLGVYLESTSAVMDLRFGPEDRVGALMPLFHTAQLNCFATPVALAGGSLDIMRLRRRRIVGAHRVRAPDRHLRAADDVPPDARARRSRAARPLEPSLGRVRDGADAGRRAAPGHRGL